MNWLIENGVTEKVDSAVDALNKIGIFSSWNVPCKPSTLRDIF
jgi:hypothetical protein